MQKWWKYWRTLSYGQTTKGRPKWPQESERVKTSQFVHRDTACCSIEFPPVLLPPRLATAHRLRGPPRNITRILGAFQICNTALERAAGALPIPGQSEELR